MATSWECPITHGQAGDVGAGVSNRNDSGCLVLGKGDFPCPEGEAAAGRTPTPNPSKASIFPGDLEAEMEAASWLPGQYPALLKCLLGL